MKRSAVSSGRPTYPRASPGPPMQISPTSPSGTGCPTSSSSTAEYVGRGRPMVTGRPGRSSHQIAVTVASVGP